MMKKVKKIANKVIRKTKMSLGVKTERYTIGKYVIDIPLDHGLPLYQQSHKLYDRFLPVLSKYFKSNETIIDIGANVGDTAVTMLNETAAKIICIEASDIYYPYLEKNIHSLSTEEQQRVSYIKSFVGTNSFTGSLSHVSGTAVVKETNEGSITFRALDELMEQETAISLIKVDTDGFDYDVLLSAQELIKKQQPVLFWENQIDNEAQSKGYEQLYDFLEQNGYKYLYLFDNFGNLMVEKTDYSVLKNINSYIYSMKTAQCTRTIYYTDVLAITEHEQERINQVIAEYKKEWINKV